MRVLTTCLALLVFFALEVHAESVDFLVAYEDTAQPPYHLGEGRAVPEPPGVSVEMVRMLREYLPELRIQFRRIPWSRCLKELEYGKVDAIFNGSFRPERMSMGAYPMRDGHPDPSRRITVLEYALYTLKNSPVIWDGQQIRHLNGPVGAPAGYSIVDDLRAWRVPMEEALNTRTTLVMLNYGRVAAVAAQTVTADKLLRDEPVLFAEVVKRQPPLVSKPYYLLISHQFMARHPGLAERIWEALASIREQRQPALYDKYAAPGP